MKVSKILLPILSLIGPYSLDAQALKQQLSALGTTPASFRIPIPTFGVAYEIVVREHLLLGIGLNGSTGLFPINGIDGGSSHASVNVAISIMFGHIGVGAKYFTQANSFLFTAYTDDSARTKLGEIKHTGRQDYIAVFLSIQITDRLIVFGGPGFEVIRNNNYSNAPESSTLQDSGRSAQWTAKTSEYEADYHNLLDRYKVYLGASIRFLDF